MRRLAVGLVLIAVTGPSALGQAPYSVRWGDAVSVVAAGVVALIPEASKLPKSAPSCGITVPCDPASLPGIDRSALHTFSGSASTASTVLLAGVIGFAGLTSFDGATSAQRRGHVAVFANSLGWTLAATDWVKVLVHRKRPVLYTSDATAAAADPNSQRSFPSELGVRQLARLDAGRHRLGEGPGSPQATGAVYLRRNGGGRRPQQPALVPLRARCSPTRSAGRWPPPTG